MHNIREVPLIMLGLGNVGRALLRQILAARETVTERRRVRLVPVALADVSGLLCDPAGLSDETLERALAVVSAGQLVAAVPGAQPALTLDAVLRPGTILADLTASPATLPTLHAALACGAGVVLANKLPLGRRWEEARVLFEHPNVRYEVTVGAGLPVIATLRYLLDTGDRVARIEGCLSGTLGYLCAQLEAGVPYSEAVSQARALGYTEPDPREDLGGKDVGRKALILARTAGWPLEPDAITIEALYSESLATASTEEFMKALGVHDADYRERVGAARTHGCTLRYVAEVCPTGGTVGLREVPQSSALGALRGPGNYVALYTERYAEIPLVIAGPGAGPEVTAAGVLGDILALASSGYA
jgi:homoserine dehydrogenase